MCAAFLRQGGQPRMTLGAWGAGCWRRIAVSRSPPPRREYHSDARRVAADAERPRLSVCTAVERPCWLRACILNVSNLETQARI